MKLVLFFLMLNVFGGKGDIIHIKADGLPIKACPLDQKVSNKNSFNEKEVYKIISKKMV